MNAGRARIWHVAILVLIIVAAFTGQLLTSIWVAHGTYRVTALQQQQRTIQQQTQPLQERLAAKSSPQNLSQAAQKLGMVSSGSPQFIDVATGTVLGAAGPDGGSVTGDSTIANAALDQAVQQAAPAQTADAQHVATSKSGSQTAESDGRSSSSATTGADSGAEQSDDLPQADLR